MHPKIKTLILATITAVFCLLITAPASAQNIDNSLCGGSNFSINANDKCRQNLKEHDGSGRINGVVQQAVNILSIIVGIVAVIMIIIGGFRYVTSAGDSGNISGAKNTIIYAIVGLIVVALAQVIVRFVINKST